MFLCFFIVRKLIIAKLDLVDMNCGMWKEQLYEEAPNHVILKKSIIHLFSLMVDDFGEFHKLAL